MIFIRKIVIQEISLVSKRVGELAKIRHSLGYQILAKILNNMSD